MPFPAPSGKGRTAGLKEETGEDIAANADHCSCVFPNTAFSSMEENSSTNKNTALLTLGERR